MPDRSPPALARPTARTSRFVLDVVLLTVVGARLAVFVRRAGARGRERWTLPWDSPRTSETLDESATRIAADALGVAPAWLEQLGAFGDRGRHASHADLSIAYVGVVPAGTPAPAPDGGGWFPLGELPALSPRHRVIVDAAMAAVRARMDQAPIAFRLLPPAFTLSELQQVYELLLGRRLHKASFRRALQAAWLVEPTDEWRSEGRGRPAQLFRYAPRKRRGGRRGVRFDLLPG